MVWTEVYERLAKAIRYQTVSHSEEKLVDYREFDDFLHFVEESYPLIYEKLHVERVADYNLLYHWPGKEPGILLLAHYDVVPEGEGVWTHPPFSGHVDDQFVWGRGTLDDKGNFILLHEVIEDLLKQGFEPEYSITLAFGADEEVGGYRGAQIMARFLEEREMRFQAIFDEGGAITQGMMPGVEVPIALVGLAEKGSSNVRITMRGTEGHSSMPPEHTAIGEMSQFIRHVERRPLPLRLTPLVQEMLVTLAPHMGPKGKLLQNLDKSFPLIKGFLSRDASMQAALRTTIACTMIEGGSAPNVLPGEVRATFNLRLLQGDNFLDVEGHLKRLAGEREIHIERMMVEEASGVTPSSSETWQAFQSVLQDVFPQVLIVPYLMSGGTDSRHYRKLSDHIFRFSGVRLQKEDVSRVHSLDERISKENIQSSCHFFRKVMEKFCGKKELTNR